jgi:hypothetical protein
MFKNFAIFSFDNGTLDHLVIRIQPARRSFFDLRSVRLRRSFPLKKKRFIRMIRRLSLPERLSVNARLILVISGLLANSIRPI